MISQKSVISLIVLGIIYGIAILFIESKMVLMTIIGIPLIALILIKPIIGFVLLIFSVPLATLPSLFPTFVFTFTNITVAKLIGGLATLSVFIHNIIQKRYIKFFKSSQGVLFLFLCGYVIFSGVTQPGAQTRECFTKYISFLMFFYLTISLVDSEEKFKLTTWTCVLGMGITSLLAILQHAKLGAEIRPGVMFYGPNYFGVSLLLIIPIAFYKFFTSKHMLSKTLAILSFVVLCLALAFTQSRGAMVGFVFVIMMLFWFPKRKVASVFLILIMLGMGAVTLPKTFWHRVKEGEISLKEEKAHTSAYRRVLLAQAGFKMLADKPLFGVGVGNFYWSSREYMPLVPGLAHNMYIEVAAELGSIGFALFMGIIIYTLKDLKEILKKAKEQNNTQFYYYAKSLLVGLVGFLIAAVFLHAEYEKFFWLVIFLTVCLRRIQEEQLVRGLSANQEEEC